MMAMSEAESTAADTIQPRHDDDFPYKTSSLAGWAWDTVGNSLERNAPSYIQVGCTHTYTRSNISNTVSHHAVFPPCMLAQ